MNDLRNITFRRFMCRTGDVKMPDVYSWVCDSCGEIASVAQSEEAAEIQASAHKCNNISGAESMNDVEREVATLKRTVEILETLLLAEALDRAITESLMGGDSVQPYVDLEAAFQAAIEKATAPLLKRIEWLENADRPEAQIQQIEPVAVTPERKIPHVVDRVRTRFGLVLKREDWSAFFQNLEDQIDNGAPFVRYERNDSAQYLLVINGKFAAVIRGNNGAFITVNAPSDETINQYGPKAWEAHMRTEAAQEAAAE
jgi:hypothetical protein